MPLFSNEQGRIRIYSSETQMVRAETRAPYAIYYSGVTVGAPLLGGFSIGSGDFWYAWCLLPQVSTSLDLPGVKVTETTFQESPLLLIP